MTDRLKCYHEALRGVNLRIFDVELQTAPSLCLILLISFPIISCKCGLIYMQYDNTMLQISSQTKNASDPGDQHAD